MKRLSLAFVGLALTCAGLAAWNPMPAAAADTVQLSPEAIALASAEIPKAEIEPIRLRDITKKIAEKKQLDDEVKKALDGALQEFKGIFRAEAK